MISSALALFLLTSTGGIPELPPGRMSEEELTAAMKETAASVDALSSKARDFEDSITSLRAKSQHFKVASETWQDLAEKYERESMDIHARIAKRDRALDLDPASMELRKAAKELAALKNYKVLLEPSMLTAADSLRATAAALKGIQGAGNKHSAYLKAIDEVLQGKDSYDRRDLAVALVNRDMALEQRRSLELKALETEAEALRKEAEFADAMKGNDALILRSFFLRVERANRLASTHGEATKEGADLPSSNGASQTSVTPDSSGIAAAPKAAKQEAAIPMPTPDHSSIYASQAPVWTGPTYQAPPPPISIAPAYTPPQPAPAPPYSYTPNINTYTPPFIPTGTDWRQGIDPVTSPSTQGGCYMCSTSGTIPGRPH